MDEHPVVFRRAAAEEILPLRHRVLREGQPSDTARFTGDDDPQTQHFAALMGDRVIGCLSLMPNPLDGKPAWQLRGMAVDPAVRRQGIGRALLRFAERQLSQQFPEPALWCNARTSAAGFYELEGWQRISEVFDVPAIGPHVRMKKCR